MEPTAFRPGSINRSVANAGASAPE